MNKFYENEIYPIGLALTTDFSWLKENYLGGDGEELVDSPNANATTFMLLRKSVEYRPMAVGICFRMGIDAKNSTHEAFHAARFSLEIGLQIPLTDASEEAWAYYIGWVGDCIASFASELAKEK